MENLRFIVVEEEKSLREISQKFEVPIFRLASQNCGVEVFRGVTLAIPNEKWKVYVVKTADTLDLILQKFHISREEFARKNGGEFICVGQKVFV